MVQVKDFGLVYVLNTPFRLLGSTEGTRLTFFFVNDARSMMNTINTSDYIITDAKYPLRRRL